MAADNVVFVINIIACCMLLNFYFPSSICEALPSGPNFVGKPKPFMFLEPLQGCQKGDNVKGVHQLKQYLNRFGYLERNYHHHHSNNDVTRDDDDDDDIFDDVLEKAIKTYQLNYHLNETGTLDFKTLKTMMTPRCGVPDIINGTTTMLSGMKKHYDHDHTHTHDSARFHIISHYNFLPGRPRWPRSKTLLTYAFHRSVPSRAYAPVARAFAIWSSVSRFKFRRARFYAFADLKIGMYKRGHWDGNPFDGRGGTLAHAFRPTDGRFHYDGDERWSTSSRPVAGAYDLQTVALHEIGHLLGLAHSSVRGSIMYPTVAAGVRKGLHQDDIRGIRALYR